jgi:small subunit ribosomal protein S1
MSEPKQPDQPTPDANESFENILAQFEQAHVHKTNDGTRQLEGTIVKVTAENVFVDIGYKTEGMLPLTAFTNQGEKP